MADYSSKGIISRSIAWKFAERFGVQGVQFIVQVVLARLLSPADYGKVALLSIFILLANNIIQNGFASALIQKRSSDDVDFSSVFYLSLLVAVVLYLCFFCFSDLIAEYYKDPELTSIFRVLSLTLVIGSFNAVQIAFVSKHMLFKRLFFSSLGANVVSGIAGVYMALNGYGVWALVTQQIVSQIATLLILWFTVKWRPVLKFSVKRIQVLFSFGSKILIMTILSTLYRNLRSLVIGRIYSVEMLGFYNRGQQFPKYIMSNIDSSIQSVMFPALARVQDNLDQVEKLMRRSIVMSAYLVFPLMMGLAIIAEPMVRVLLTDKWLSTVPYIWIFCATYALWPIHTANLQAIKAIGKSDVVLKLTSIKIIFGVGILLITLKHGTIYIAFGELLSGIVNSVINAKPNSKLLKYSYIEQISDLSPSLLLSCGMGVVIFLLRFLGLSPLHLLIIQVTTGTIFYLVLSCLLKLEPLQYIVQVLHQVIKRKEG